MAKAHTEIAVLDVFIMIQRLGHQLAPRSDSYLDHAMSWSVVV
jgi:hypothetical protein